MVSLLYYLYNAQTEFFIEKEKFSDYQIVLAISKADLSYTDEAKSMIIRADAKEPMNFEMEANALYMRIMIHVALED